MTTIELASPVDAVSRTLPKKRSRAGYNQLMKVLRRAHLYSGLFLTPWVFLYGVTALLFNHPDLFSGQQVIEVGPAEVAGTPLAQIPPPGALAARVVEKLNASDAVKAGEEFRLVDTVEAKYAQPLSATFRREGSGDKPFNFRFDLATRQGAIREGAGRGGRGSGGGERVGAGTGRTDRAVIDETAPGERTDGGTDGERRRAERRGAPGTRPSAAGGERAGGEGTRGERRRGGGETGRGAEGGESLPSGSLVLSAGLDLPEFEGAAGAVPAVLANVGVAARDVDVRFAPELTFRMEGRGQEWRTRYNPLTGAVTATPLSADGASEALGVRRFLQNLHKAHGYPSDFGPRWAWAVVVDVMFVAMVGWGLTGMLMWWQMKNLRLVGSAILVVSAVVATVMMIGMHGVFAT